MHIHWACYFLFLVTPRLYRDPTIPFPESLALEKYKKSGPLPGSLSRIQNEPQAIQVSGPPLRNSTGPPSDPQHCHAYPLGLLFYFLGTPRLYRAPTIPLPESLALESQRGPGVPPWEPLGIQRPSIYAVPFQETPYLGHP